MLVGQKAWYALSVTGGKEVKIMNWLNENKARFDITDDILDEIFLPTNKKLVVTNNKKRVIETSASGHYIYFHGDASNEKLIFFFSQAPNVYSYVGSKNGGFKSGASVIMEKDINRMKNIEDTSDNDVDKSLAIGDDVTISSGSFQGFKGVIKEINVKTNIAKVSVMIFGGENVVEVQLPQIKKIK